MSTIDLRAQRVDSLWDVLTAQRKAAETTGQFRHEVLITPEQAAAIYDRPDPELGAVPASSDGVVHWNSLTLVTRAPVPR